MKNKLFFIVLIFLCATTNIQAQSIHFFFTDNTEATYSLNQVRNITFTSDVMNLNLIDNSTVSWNVIYIGHYEYDVTSSIIENDTKIYSLDIYPNPGKGWVTLNYDLNQQGKVAIEMLDLQGHIVSHIYSGTQQAGKQSIVWNISSNIASGTYLCRLATDKQIITKIVIIHQ